MLLADITPASELRIEFRADSSLGMEEDRQLRRLLLLSFPHETSFLTRRFIKQRPAFRWLAFDREGEIVAHAALHEKTLGTSTGDLRVGGVSEVCVATNYRRHGLGKKLLSGIHEWLGEHGVEFAMLFGQKKIYESSGYRVIANELRADNSLARHWNPFCGKPMVKPLGAAVWPPGVIDLRGPTF